MGEMSDNPAEWNIDEEILKLIKEAIVCFFRDLRDWRLDAAYWNLNIAWIQAEAKFKETEQKELKEDMDALEVLRKGYLQDKKGKAGEFWYKLRDFYIKLNRLSKKHNMWLREREDIGL